MAGDGATSPAATQGFVLRFWDRATGRIISVKVDQVGIVSGCCPPLQRHSVGVVAGGAGYAAVYHMAGMFVDAAISKGAAGHHDIIIRVAAEQVNAN